MQQFYHRMHKVFQDLSSFWALKFSPTSIVAEQQNFTGDFAVFQFWKHFLGIDMNFVPSYCEVSGCGSCKLLFPTIL